MSGTVLNLLFTYDPETCEWSPPQWSFGKDSFYVARHMTCMAATPTAMSLRRAVSAIARRGADTTATSSTPGRWHTDQQAQTD